MKSKEKRIENPQKSVKPKPQKVYKYREIKTENNHVIAACVIATAVQSHVFIHQPATLVTHIITTLVLIVVYAILCEMIG